MGSGWEGGVRKNNYGVKLIDEPIYSYWQALYMSYYSRRFYIDVIKRWHGFGFKYIFFILALGAIPLTVRFADNFIHYFDDTLIYPIEHMPLLMIQNGQASIEKPIPYFLKSKSGKDVVEIDTSVSTKEFPKDKKDLTILITKENFYFRPALGELLSEIIPSELREKVSSYPFEQKDNEIFSGRDWVKASGIKYWKFYGALLIYPTAIGSLLSFCFIYNVVMASIGRIISIVVLKHRMKFIQSFRLSFVASTPVLIPLIFMLSMGYKPPNLTLYYPLVVALYFSFGVLADKRYSKQLVRA